MNKLDMVIIKELQRDSRTSYSDLSIILKKPSSTIHDHVKKLVSERVIRAYTIKVDDSRTGLDYKALLGIETGAKLFRKVADELCKMDDITDVFATTAEFDLMIKVKVSSRTHLAHTLDRIRKIEGVNDIYVISILDVLKEDGFLLNESPQKKT